MQALYTLIYSLGFVLFSPLFLYKMWKRGKYRDNFLQRFGGYAPDLRQRLAAKTGPRCWIQAVSVGEMNLALTLIPALRRRLPQFHFIVTTTTSTGYALGRERLSSDVVLLYFPQDFPWIVRRAYDLVAPDCVVLMESEIWPNHVWEGARRNIPLTLVNARMSPRSVRRHRYVQWLFRGVFSKLTLVVAQSETDAANFRAVGVPFERVVLAGNLKYDASLPQPGAPAADPAQALQSVGVATSRPILVAGSTHPGEEEILFDLLRELRRAIPDLFLVLVPRHVERAPEIIELAKRKQVALVLRKGNNAAGGIVAPYDCLLVNTTGELKSFYQIATVIFVGKSLAGQGGQNIVEAAASGHPVVFGPHMQNFKAIAAQFVAAGAGMQVADAAGLRAAIQELLADEPRRRKIADAARAVIAANVGATDRTVELVAQSLAK